MSRQNRLGGETLVWLLDDEFDSNQIDQICRMIENRGFELVVSRSRTFRSDYPRYAPYAKGVLLQVGFPLGVISTQAIFDKLEGRVPENIINPDVWIRG